jgi:Rhomboid family
MICTTITLITLNILVHVAWRQSWRHNAWVHFMYNHFTSHPFQIEIGRYHTLLTCLISHMKLPHLSTNCLGLMSCALVEQRYGSIFVLALFVSGALVASIADAVNRTWFNRPVTALWQWDGPMVGSSGGVMSLLVVLAYMNVIARYAVALILLWDLLMIACRMKHVTRAFHEGHVLSAILGGIVILWL